MKKIFYTLFAMFLALYGTSFAQNDHPYYHTVYRATSSDGINFTPDPTPLALHTSVPGAVRTNNGIIFMYAMTFTAPNTAGKLSVATSANGRTFSAFQPVVIANNQARVGVDPHPVLLPDGRIRLYYMDIEQGTTYELYSAVSTDGINFTADAGARLTRNGIMTDPDVVKIGTMWNAYVSVAVEGNTPKLMRAVSVDGLNFTWDTSFNFEGSLSSSHQMGSQIRTYFARQGGIMSALNPDGRTLNVESGYRMAGAFDPTLVTLGTNNYILYYKKIENGNNTPPPQNQTESWKFGKLVIGRQANNDLTATITAMADVIRLPDQTYRMYYGSGTPGNAEIRVASSPDAKTWSYLGVALRGNISPTDRQYIINGARVIRLSNGLYRMYYTAMPKEQNGQIYGWHIRSAISTDGIRFTAEAGVRMEIASVDPRSSFAALGHGAFWLTSNGTYAAVVSGNPIGGGTGGLYVATSTDGLTWGNYRLLFTGYHDPIVMKVGSKYVMYTGQNDQVTARTESADGLTWTQTPTPLNIKDANNNTIRYIEDVGGVISADNKTLLYANYRSNPNGAPDHIALYEMETTQGGGNNGGGQNNCSLTVSAIVKLATTTATNDGGITVNVTGGTPPYTYQLDNQPAQNSNTFSNLMSRGYSVRVSDSKGCIGNVSVSVNGYNSGGNATTERWYAKQYAVGVKASNETSEGGSIIMANVIRMQNNTYRMFYNSGGPGKSKIKWVTSTDGINWTAGGTAITGGINPIDRDYIIGGASVIKLSDGRYRMYYRCCSEIINGQPPKYHIRSAISTDGATFTFEAIRIDITPYDANSPFKLVGHSSFYYIPASNSYAAVMSVNTNNDNGASDLYIGFSSDGLTWGNYRRLYEDVHDPVVIYKDGKYMLYAMYLNRYTGKAVSTDGINWSSNMEVVYAYDLEGKDAPLIGDVGGIVLTESNQLLLYGNYQSGLMPFDDHIVVYQLKNSGQQNNVCAGNPVMMTLSVNNATCATCSNGMIRTTVFGGQAPYQYTLNGQNVVSSGIFNNLPSGNYTIGVIDARGCKTSGTGKVEVISQNNPCPVPMNVNVRNVSTSGAMVSWNQVIGAQGYMVGIRLRQLNTIYTYSTVPMNQTTYNIVGLQANTPYEVEVRTLCSNNVRSEGSSAIAFITLGNNKPLCPSIQSLFGSPTRNYITAVWNQVANVQGYMVSYRGENQTVSQTTFVPASRNYLTIGGLNANTRYYIEVKTRCADGSYGEPKNISVITTNNREKGEENITDQWNLYPNPNDGNFSFMFTAEKAQTVKLIITDITGRRISEQLHEIENSTNNVLNVALETPSTGIYWVELQVDGHSYRTKMVIR